MRERSLAPASGFAPTRRRNGLGHGFNGDPHFVDLITLSPGIDSTDCPIERKDPRPKCHGFGSGLELG